MHCSSAGRLLSTFCSKSIGETNFGAMACYFVHELCDNDSRHSGNTVIRGKTLCFGARDWSVAIPCQHVFCTESRQVDFYYIFSYQDPTSLRFEDSIKAAPLPLPPPCTRCACVHGASHPLRSPSQKRFVMEYSPMT
jgi:hypothetical protein